MNKTKRVAWHKHLKTARRAKEKARLERMQARGGATPARGASGVHARPAGASGAARQTPPRP
jgi:hypothetical protein